MVRRLWRPLVSLMIRGGALLWICLCMMLPVVQAERAGQHQNVLLLASYHRGHSWTNGEVDGVLQVLQTADPGINVFVEYLDWKRFPSAQHLQLSYQDFSFKYKNKTPFDVIITMDDAALGFALQHRGELFADAPIVFGGVLEQAAQPMLAAQERVTGVYEALDFAGTLQTMRTLQPDLETVYLVYDHTESAQAARLAVDSAIAEFDKKLAVRDLSEYPFTDILSLVQALPAHSAVLMFSYNTDYASVRMTQEELFKQVSAASRVPVYSPDEAALGTGVTGGSLLSAKIHGNTMGGLAVRLLSGTALAQLPIVTEKSVYYGFDQEQLQRFKLPSDKLPAGSRIINKPFSFIDTYRDLVYSTIAAFSALVVLVCGLLWNIKKRRAAERVLRQNNEDLSCLYEELSASEEEIKSQFGELLLQQERIHALAYQDVLTGLPNRLQLREWIAKVCGDSRRPPAMALLFIDLDNFKYINDSFGHMMGDKLLMQVSRRLQNMPHTAFRLGGDEFLVLLEQITERAYIDQYAAELLAVLQQPYQLLDRTLYLTASIGVVLAPEHGTCFDELLKNADTAMYKAKEVGRSRYMFFTAEMAQAVVKKVNLQNDLRMALAKEEFCLYYQPQLDVRQERICGFEALVRWQSPAAGLVLPGQFISAAEETGLIVPLGRWVLTEACHCLHRWHQRGFAALTISVNISMVQLMQNDFVEMVDDILQQTHVQPTKLILEITESMLMESYEVVNDKLALLTRKGICIALDDFGCGYSSLTYLQKLPISILKIDKSFIQDLPSAYKDTSLLAPIIALAKQLGLKTTAEGVEQVEQLHYLRKYGCEYCQGYLFSKPVPETEACRLLEVGCQAPQRVWG